MMREMSDFPVAILLYAQFLLRLFRKLISARDKSDGRAYQGYAARDFGEGVAMPSCKCVMLEPSAAPPPVTSADDGR